MIPAILNNTNTFPHIYGNNTPSFGVNPAKLHGISAGTTSFCGGLPKPKTSFAGKLIQGIKLGKVVKNMVSDIPEQLQSAARELARKNMHFDSQNKPFYRVQNLKGLCLPSGNAVGNNRIALKLDLLSKLDPKLYVGSHEHPFNYISGTQGYECFKRLGFANFEKALDLKLYEFALLLK